MHYPGPVIATKRHLWVSVPCQQGGVFGSSKAIALLVAVWRWHGGEHSVGSEVRAGRCRTRELLGGGVTGGYGDGGGKTADHCRRTHWNWLEGGISGIVGLYVCCPHSWWVGVAHGVFWFVLHLHIAIKWCHPPVWQKRTILIFWRLHFHFCLFRLTLEFHASILEPSLHLHVRELQSLSQLSPLGWRQVFLIVELLLKLWYLLSWKCCTCLLSLAKLIIFIILISTSAGMICKMSKSTFEYQIKVYTCIMIYIII